MRSRREAFRLKAVLEGAQKNNAAQSEVPVLDADVAQFVEDKLAEDMEDLTEHAVLLPEGSNISERGYGTTKWFKDSKGEKP